MINKIEIMEVGLRDGLQNIKQNIGLETRLFIVNSLIEAGVKHIQVASFVNPKLVPQMECAEDLVRKLPQKNDIVYSGLVFNEKGVERAIATGLKKIETSISISESYSKRNLGISVSKSLNNLKNIIGFAEKNGLLIRAGLQCVWGCLYDGKILKEKIINTLSSIIEMGIDHIALCDTMGMANPNSISNLLEVVYKKFPNIKVSIHLHDTYGLGIKNLYSALQFNINAIDTSFGGIGGSPFIENSKGNIATEDSVSLLTKMNYKTEIDIKKVSNISRFLEKEIGSSYFTGKLYKSI